MKLEGNTMFITGGTSGIGRGLAEAFHRLGNRVVVAGRREDRLRDLSAANPGMSWFALDVADAANIRTVAAQVTARFPDLNAVFNCAGIQREHDMSFAGDGRGVDDRALDQEVDTNFAGLVRVSAALLPHLRARTPATLLNVSSGLAFVPLARFPIYCATKAAVHSFSVSLRRQLRDSGVRVIELIPPYVDTELDQGRRPPHGLAPMPLDQFIAETMTALAGDEEEVAIGPAKSLRDSVVSEAFRSAFARMNG